MSDIRYINLQEYLQMNGRGSYMKVIGVVEGEIAIPREFNDLILPSAYTMYRMRVIGVDLQIGGRSEKYYVKGDMPIVLNRQMVDLYNSKESKRMGVVVEGLISMYKWKNDAYSDLVLGFKRENVNNKWTIRGLKTTPINKVEYPEFFNKIYALSKNNWVMVEEDIDSNIRKIGGIGYNILNNIHIQDVILEANESAYTLESNQTTKVVDRDTVLKVKAIDHYVDKAKTLRNQLNTMMVNIEKEMGEYKGLDNLLDRFKDRLRFKWHEGGRRFFLDLFKNTSFYTDIVDLESMKGENLLDIWEGKEVIKGKETLCGVISKPVEEVYVAYMGYKLGLSKELDSVYMGLKEKGVSMITILHTNPYYIGLYTEECSMATLDLLYKMYSEEIKSNKYYNVKRVVSFREAIRWHIALLTNKDSSTLIELSNFNIKKGGIQHKKFYDEFIVDGCLIDKDTLTDLRDILGLNIVNENLVISTKNVWVEDKSKGIVEERGGILSTESYEFYGLGIVIVKDDITYVIDIVHFLKEVEIYERMQDSFKSDLGLKEGHLERLIEKYENRKSRELGIDFKLDTVQSSIPSLLQNQYSCLTGGAGSGKTTCVELLVDICESIGKRKIICVAPTGRASSRMREVLKRRTSTIHSYFGIGTVDNSISNILKDREEVKEVDVIFVDESSMVDVDIMYEVVKGVSRATQIIFVGDVGQLSAIGKGKPYSDLLRYIPTKVLEEQKRALDNSGVIKAGKRIREGLNVVTTEDFTLIDSTINNTCDEILAIVSKELREGTSKDDIQVISPINKYDWGVDKLNTELQYLLNKDSSKVVVITNYGNTNRPTIEYKVGDRVYHKVNSKDTQRLDRIDGEYVLLKESMQHGVMNGDVGKVVDIVDARDIQVCKELRKLSKKPLNTKYLIVEYTDMDVDKLEKKKYYILYQFNGEDRGRYIDVKVSRDLNLIGLSYAMTTHKLQGSEVKVVILALQKVGGNFINRNLLYTSVSRSKERCYIVGDVKSKDNESRVYRGYNTKSALELGIKIVQTDHIKTLVDTVIL